MLSTGIIMIKELELELILSHMTQKPMLRGEVGARDQAFAFFRRGQMLKVSGNLGGQMPNDGDA